MSLIDYLIDNFIDPLVTSKIFAYKTFSTVFGFGIRLIGPFFILGFYALIYLHLVSFFDVTLVVLAKKLGPEFGLFWVAIGLCIVYNVFFNHTFAYMVKPGNAQDLEVRFEVYTRIISTILTRFI